MKDKSKQPDSLTPAPDTGREFAARRTIIKGIASSVPVVMTIGSGHAMAQTSASCVVEPNPQPTTCLTEAEWTAEDPKYARVEVDPTQCVDTGSSAEASRKLLLVNENGEETDQTFGTAVTTSCYNSFNPV
jgi:hypothetical protein